VYIEEKMNQFTAAADVETTMSPAMRRRLVGAGVKNYGFIDKAYDIARDNPKALPAGLTAEAMWKDMHDFEEARQLVAVLEQFLLVAKEYMAIIGDQCFRDALFIYDNLKMQSKNREPWATPLYEMLMSFFKKRRKPGEAEPTTKEIERDVRKLLFGHADGEIIIKNETPVVQGRKREVIDDIHKDRVLVKKTKQAEVEE
jgi:hypothetical protein